MRILITGANGLLGQKIVEQIVRDGQHDLLATSKGDNRNRVLTGYQYQSLDITDKPEVLKAIGLFKPDAVINTAAMTNVDQCETEKAECWLANFIAVENLIAACQLIDARLIHLSTDFVFDGENGPYSEGDLPNPLSYYGESKYKAEILIQNSGLKKWSIARTIIVFGKGHQLSRGNIVFWVKQMLSDQKEITIVDDQFRSPTLAEDLAAGCLLIAEKEANGIWHLSGPETISIYELACTVADYFQLDKGLIKPVKTGIFTQPAKRPLRTGFSIEKAKSQLGYQPRTILQALDFIEQDQ